MKNIREIITDLNVARSNSCPQEKSEEIKKIINDLLPHEKSEKALEIIKKYNIRPTDFHYHKTYNIYLCNMSFADDFEIMSEDEYNLLKEVLL